MTTHDLASLTTVDLDAVFGGTRNPTTCPPFDPPPCDSPFCVPKCDTVLCLELAKKQQPEPQRRPNRVPRGTPPHQPGQPRPNFR